MIKYVVITMLVLLNVARAGNAEDTQVAIYYMLFALLHTIVLCTLYIGDILKEKTNENNTQRTTE